MNLLYWKEWREQRIVVAAMPLVTFALIIGYAVCKSAGALGENRTPALDGGAVAGFLAFTWLMSAALCGAQVMAPEVSSGTLRFLTMLPVTRGRLWRGKVLAGAGATLGCMAGASLVTLAVCALLRQFHQFDDDYGQLLNGFAGAAGLAATYLLCLAALVFSIGCYATMLLEKTINVVLVTVVASVVAVALISPANKYVETTLGWYAFVSALFLWMSLRTFQLGETLQTSRRFSILRWPRLVGDLLLVAASLLVAFLWIMR